MSNATPPPADREQTGQVAWVTGASSGIGQAIAIALARQGWSLILGYRQNKAGADQTLAAVRQVAPSARILAGDLSDQSTRERLADEAWQFHDRVDLLVNNAGVDVLTGQAQQLEFMQKLDALWQVDVCATIDLSRRLGTRMSEHVASSAKPYHPHIINIGWDQSAAGMEGDSGEMFSAIKGAVASFSLSLAKSLAPHVRVNCVAPGWIKTSWGEGASEYWDQRAKRESLLARWGTPEDVANIVAFLASPSGQFINGQIVPVNGGFRK